MKRNIVIAVVTAAALAGGGTATALAVSEDDAPRTRAAAETRAADDDARDGDDDRNEDRDEDRDEDRGRADDGDDGDDDAKAASPRVTAADAIAAALKHTPGTAVSAELDDDGDGGAGAAWEVDVLGGGDTWHSVRVDPGSGKVLGDRKEDEDDAGEVRTALKGTSVTAGEAAKAAAAEGTVVSVDLDDDRGWEAGTRSSGGNERDWRVDPESGKVTADRSDAADDDGSDD